MQIYRGWIDQPSTLQPYHDQHGQRCIVMDDGNEIVDVYFTEGPIHSQRMHLNAISRLYISDAETRHRVDIR